MANICMKSHTYMSLIMSLIVREIQIKTTMRYHLHKSEWLSSINQQTVSAGENVEKGDPFCTVGGNAGWCSHCAKTFSLMQSYLFIFFSFVSLAWGDISNKILLGAMSKILLPMFSSNIFMV